MSDEKTIDIQATWVRGLQFVTYAEGSGTTIALDSAFDPSQPGRGTRPTEMVLMGLAGCTGMDVISILRKKRQKITSFMLNVKGTSAPEHPRYFTHIDIEYIVRGYDVDPAALARAIELSETKYCSVMASLKAEISSTYRVEQEDNLCEE